MNTPRVRGPLIVNDTVGKKLDLQTVVEAQALGAELDDLFLLVREIADLLDVDEASRIAGEHRLTF